MNTNTEICIAIVTGFALAVSIVLILLSIVLIVRSSERRHRDALRETLAELAREQNISEAEAAMRKMRGQ